MTKPVPATASTPAWAHGLSDREQRFVLEYLVGLNLRAATARAGLGKTPASAGVIARKMRDKPAVAEAIAKLMQERHGLQASRIVSELGAFSYSRLTDYMEVKDGQLTIKDSASWREEMKSAVSETALRSRATICARIFG
jgi:phage terminase small subunit